MNDVEISLLGQQNPEISRHPCQPEAEYYRLLYTPDGKLEDKETEFTDLIYTTDLLSNTKQIIDTDGTTEGGTESDSDNISSCSKPNNGKTSAVYRCVQCQRQLSETYRDYVQNSTEITSCDLEADKSELSATLEQSDGAFQSPDWQPPELNSVLLLYHPKRLNVTFNLKILKLSEVLNGNFLEVKTGVNIEGNYLDFAESAVKKFHDIVFILSQELVDFCDNYFNRDRVDTPFSVDGTEEMISGIVLEKLQESAKQTVKRYSCSVHIVSLEDDEKIGRQLIEDFLKNNDFLIRVRAKYYNIFGSCPSCLSDNRQLRKLLQKLIIPSGGK